MHPSKLSHFFNKISVDSNKKNFCPFAIQEHSKLKILIFSGYQLALFKTQ